MKKIIVLMNILAISIGMMFLSNNVLAQDSFNYQPANLNTIFSHWVIEHHIIGKKWIEQHEVLKDNEINEETFKEKLPQSMKNYTIRLIPDGSIVTLEYKPNRVNIQLNHENVIGGVYIG